MVDYRERSFAITLFGRRFLAFRSRRESGLQDPAPTGETVHDVSPADRDPLFVVSSLLLHDCHQQLTQTEAESLHVVTGPVVGRTRFLERIVPLELGVQSITGAEADAASSAEQFIGLYEFGLFPLAYFHSHPGSGPSATLPSPKDRDTQSRLESSKSAIIGAIFSRDGYVRFYANQWQPQVRVIGERAKELDTNVYQLLQ